MNNLEPIDVQGLKDSRWIFLLVGIVLLLSYML